MKALIDGDIVLYRACLSVEIRMYTLYNELGEPVACSPRKKDIQEYIDNHPNGVLTFETYIEEDAYTDAVFNYHSMLKRILRQTSAKEHAVYFTGGGNFRKDIYTEYKANRKAKPILYKSLLKYVLKLPHHFLEEGQEADDRLGIEQNNNSIICTIDKDLLMVKGHHYNFVKDEFTKVTEKEGTKFFYKQILTGDRVDNIPGLKGVGDKRADKILEGLTDEHELYSKVLEAYDGDEETVTRNARLLYIRREEDELWQPPKVA